ncbi:MAG: ABC transporter permease [Hyphomicrobiales bacterium]|nr:ABC transporter permease [Hyphomicrobiales bacterium]MCP4998383.1 ABC transporter permease [Hyphomicrobiales bacterium]
MFNVVANRILWACLMMAAISVVAFTLIQLPPGDFVDSYVNHKQQGGVIMTKDEVAEMRGTLGLDRPMYVQYFDWVGGVVQGDFGFSWEFRRPVSEIIGERLPLTLILAFTTLLFTYLTAIPIGIYSAVRQYSVGDHVFTVLGYIGLATPNFMFALVLLYFAHVFFGTSAGGLFSAEFETAPWSWARIVDLLAHLWVPVVVLGTAGTAFQIRTMRATLLDELNKLYVTAARASGVSEFRLLIKYPVRMAINPIVSTIGWELTNIISGAPIVGIVLSLPDTGPLFVDALLNSDLYLAGALILIYCGLVIIGTLISDLLLIALDPRIRMGSTA